MADLDTRPAVSRVLLVLVPLAIAFSSANLYYVQPLLPMLATDTGTPDSVLGLITTLGQIGFIAGVLLVLPLGDMVNRRVLIPLLMTLAATAQFVAAALGTVPGLLVTALPIGIGAAAAQVLVPYSGDLAAPDRRAHAVGRSVGALLAGILLARTLSGLVADAWGWRAVYLGSAMVLTVLAVALWRNAPDDDHTGSARDLNYGQLLRSTAALARSQPWLRRIAVSGAVTFAAFNLFWTAIGFRMADAPYDWSAAMIGTLSLVGVAGIVVANLVGPQVQRGRARSLTGLGVLLVAAAFGLAIPDFRSVVLLLLVAIVLDIGVQAVHAVNQCTLAAKAGTERSRANAVYMSTYFLGGAVGSAIAPAIYSAFSFTGVACAGLVAAAIACAHWWRTSLRKEIW